MGIINQSDYSFITEKLEWTVHFSQMNSIRRFRGQIQSIKQQCGIKWKQHIKEPHALWSHLFTLENIWGNCLIYAQINSHYLVSMFSEKVSDITRVVFLFLFSNSFQVLWLIHTLWLRLLRNKSQNMLHHTFHPWLLRVCKRRQFEFVSSVLSVMSVSGFQSAVCLHKPSVDSAHAQSRGLPH